MNGFDENITKIISNSWHLCSKTIKFACAGECIVKYVCAGKLYNFDDADLTEHAAASMWQLTNITT